MISSKSATAENMVIKLENDDEDSEEVSDDEKTNRIKHLIKEYEELNRRYDLRIQKIKTRDIK